VTRLRFFWAWLLYGRLRCEALSHNWRGEDVTGNAFSIIFNSSPGKRCEGRAVAGTKTFWGCYNVNLCREHADAAQTFMSVSR
jgi:hypothetical protein